MDELFVKQSRAEPEELTFPGVAAYTRYWIPLAVYAAAIVYLSSLSHPARFLPGLSFSHADKIVHVLEYALLAILCYRAFRYAAGPWAARYPVMVAVCASVGFGATDELHQWFVPFRDPSWWDLAADSLGAGFAAGSWHFSFGTVSPIQRRRW